MYIDPIKINDIYKDYTDIRSKVAPDDKSSVIFEGLPVYGRINSVPEKAKNNDYGPMMGLVSLAVLNGPEDIRDVMSAYKQIKEGFKKPRTVHSGYDNKEAQHPFSFFRGTILNDYLNPNSPDCPNPKAAAWLIKQDKTLWDTKLGKWVKDKLKIEDDDIITTIDAIEHTNNNKKKVLAKIITADNPFKDIAARAMIRTTKLGTLALAGIEATHVAKEVSDGKNFFAEAGKSALTLGSAVVATGILGAIGAKHLGPTGSLVGIGLGAITGAYINQKLNH